MEKITKNQNFLHAFMIQYFYDMRVFEHLEMVWRSYEISLDSAIHFLKKYSSETLQIRFDSSTRQKAKKIVKSVFS